MGGFYICSSSSLLSSRSFGTWTIAVILLLSVTAVLCSDCRTEFGRVKLLGVDKLRRKCLPPQGDLAAWSGFECFEAWDVHTFGNCTITLNPRSKESGDGLPCKFFEARGNITGAHSAELTGRVDRTGLIAHFNATPALVARLSKANHSYEKDLGLLADVLTSSLQLIIGAVEAPVSVQQALWRSAHTGRGAQELPSATSHKAAVGEESAIEASNAAGVVQRGMDLAREQASHNASQVAADAESTREPLWRSPHMSTQPAVGSWVSRALQALRSMCSSFEIPRLPQELPWRSPRVGVDINASAPGHSAWQAIWEAGNEGPVDVPQEPPWRSPRQGSTLDVLRHVLMRRGLKEVDAGDAGPGNALLLRQGDVLLLQPRATCTYKLAIHGDSKILTPKVTGFLASPWAVWVFVIGAALLVVVAVGLGYWAARAELRVVWRDSQWFSVLRGSRASEHFRPTSDTPWWVASWRRPQQMFMRYSSKAPSPSFEAHSPLHDGQARSEREPLLTRH